MAQSHDPSGWIIVGVVLVFYLVMLSRRDKDNYPD